MPLRVRFTCLETATRCTASAELIQLNQRVVKPWNSLNIMATLDDWSSVAELRTLIKNTDLSEFLHLV